MSKKRQNYEASWLEPWIFDKNMSLSLSVYKKDNVRHGKKGNDNQKISKEKTMENDERTGFKIDLGPRISELVSLSFGYEYENVNYYSIEEEKGKISSVFSSFLYDSRNYIFDPSKGNVQFITLQIASDVLGGNKNFIKGVVDSKWFFPTFWRFVLSANLHVGLVTSYGNQSVPVYERFYIGGTNTVRGYDRDEIKPYMGGKLMGIINVEHRFPIISQSNRTVIQGFLFYDVGGLWERKGEERKLYQSVGFGVRLPIPMLPMEFDCAYGLTGNKGKLKFYFNLGNIF